MVKQNKTIVHFEMVNIMIALKLWSKDWKHKHIHFAVDNAAVVTVCNTGFTRDKWLATYIRNIWLITSIHDITISVSHITGHRNVIADLLSKWDTTASTILKLEQLVENPQWQQLPEHIFDVNLKNFILFSEKSPLASLLSTKVNSRLKQAYSAKTWSTYKNMFCLFLSFLFLLDYDIVEVDVTIVCMLIEYLALNQLKVSSIRNYLAGIATHFQWLSLDVSTFKHHKVCLMLKGIEKSITSMPKFKAIFSVQQIHSLLGMCDTLPLSILHKTFAYLGFFRIYNLVPSSRKTFSILKHLCRADVMCSDQGLITIVKWSKTMQASNQGSYIILP